MLIKTKENIIGLIIIVIRKILSFFPLKIRYKFFEKLGILAYYLIKKRRKITIENIKNAFPEKSEKEVIQIAKKSYNAMGKMIMTSIFLEDITKNNNTYIQNEELIQKISKKTKNGIILVSLHLGGFEAGSILKKIRPFYAVFRKQKNKQINDLMCKWRKEGSLNLLNLNDLKGLNKVLQEKTILALASDHYGEDVEIEYFGRKVKAVGGPVLLGIRKKVPLILAYALFEDNYKIKIVIDKIIEIEKQENTKETIKYNMQKIYNEFERIVSENPEQYMWQHNRWKN